MWQYHVLIVSLCSLWLPSSAFWWPKATTETPRAQMQQIPLTYFRTYTYQPLQGDPFGMPLFGFGAAQTPLLSERHFDPYAVTSYAAARRHDVNAPGYKPEVTPPDASASLGTSSASSTTPAPTTTTTSTTTTTTPAPTTTMTTTTTTSTTPAPAPAPTESSGPSSSLRYGAYNTAEYPTYNRRVNNFYNARPQYPYPDYFNYQPPAPSALSEQQKPSGSRIQFVPCMCPVSMSGMSNPGLTSHPTSTERDRPSSVSISNVPPPVPVEATELSPGLQARHIESEESELDDESETSSSSAEAEADADVAVDSKLALDPPNTTPTVESNSVV